jgi:hypothetical protein
MRDHDATVVAIADPDLESLRAEWGVPPQTATCHAALIDGYVVDGHVPVEAIARLLADRPDAVGITVPGMPADSPGMGGDAATWAALDVLEIGHDGQLTLFDF